MNSRIRRHRGNSRLPLLGAFAILLAGPTRASVPATFFQRHCFDCHDADIRKGDLDLSALGTDLSDGATARTWTKVHDRLRAGEMPPKDEPHPDANELAEFLRATSANLTAASSAAQARDGRVQFRRLNRVEYEATLRDLLGLPHLEVKEMLPEDNVAHGFDNVGAALALSYVQMSRYLEAADLALDKAMSLRPRPETLRQRIPAHAGSRMAQATAKKREAVRVGDSVVLLRQPNQGQAPWTWSQFAPEVEGLYRFRLKAFGLTWDKGEIRPPDRPHAVSFYAREGFNRRRLATLDLPATRDPSGVVEFTAFCKPGEQLELNIATLDGRQKFNDGDVEQHTGAAVAIDWLETEGPLLERWPATSHVRLFGDLPVVRWAPESGFAPPRAPRKVVGAGKRAATRVDETAPRYMVVSAAPAEDAARLLLAFARAAFRRPVAAEEIEPYSTLVAERLAAKLTFHEAMCIGYKAMLCSPEFLFFHERPGRLEGPALASRLSYFLWSSAPDERLRRLAENGELTRPEVLRAEVERLLGDARSQRFVENFAGQWLDLRRLTVNEPDDQLYPEFDQLLEDSMLWEAHAYFSEMLRSNLAVSHVVDSDFAMLNARLAALYGVPGVHGVAMRKVPLPAGSPRGGLLTQASVLKVTANGTTTSPVTRGAWVMSRILGQPLPPPPPNTPAIEPDLRGATTIRGQLEKHRSVASCASCHTKMDPPGFALESFDVIGGWRDRYRALEHGAAVSAAVRGRAVRYKLGLPVDASGEVADGRTFRNVDDFRAILLTQQEQLARALAGKLLIYATGAEVQFADRAVIEAIVAETKSSGHGLRALVHAVVQSRPFQIK